MKKILLIATGILIFTPFIQNAFSAALSQSGGGGTAVTVDAGNVAGAQDVTFNPSTNVVMSGVANSTQYAIGAYHTQALEKASGQAYGMASDANKIYFMDISQTGATPAVTGSNATFFSTANDWNIM